MSELAKIKIETDGGPWARHNYPCPVHGDEPAVLNLDDGVFHPSWKAQDAGWMLVKATGLRARIIRALSQDDVKRGS